MTATPKHLVQTILSETAILMLKDDRKLNSVIQNALRARFTQMTKTQTKEVVQDFYTVKQAMSKLVEKLIACENPDAIAQVMLVIEGINTGNVYIAAEGQEIIEE